MQELFLGIDICDDYSQVSFYNPQIACAESMSFSEEQESSMIPTVICKEKGTDSWMIGEEAYRFALYGKGTMVDKLVRLAGKSGSATIEGVKYTAEDLMVIFIGKLLDMAQEKAGADVISSVVFTFQEKNPIYMEAILRAGNERGIAGDQLHLANHSECYLFYMLSQSKDLWINQSCLFDLTENGLHYYEFNAIRGRKPQIAEVKHEELEDAFKLEILETNAGKKLGDKILRSCAERMLSRKVFTSVFLTGKGFEEISWAEDFTKFICQKRKVLSGSGLFSGGAAYMAFDFTLEESSYPYITLCEGRLHSTISLHVQHAGRERELVIAQAGSDWFEAKSKASFILDGTDTLFFHVTPAGNGKAGRFSMKLDEFPKRPNKTTKVDVIAVLLDESTISIRVIDRGFGDFFPGTGLMMRKDFNI